MLKILSIQHGGRCSSCFDPHVQCLVGGGEGGTSVQGVYRYVRPKVYALFSFSVRNGIVSLTILVSLTIYAFFWKKLLYSLTGRSKTRH